MLSAAKVTFWASRPAVFTVAAALAAFCAYAALWIPVFFYAVLLGVELPEDVILPVALACGAVVGMAAASGSELLERLERGTIAAVALTLVVFAPIAVWMVWPEPDFDPVAFRQAVVAQDLDEVETQAYRAVHQDALEGRTKDEIRWHLGSPDSADRSGWRWNLGIVNDELGPGDQGWLTLTFDPRTERVSRASVP